MRKLLDRIRVWRSWRQADPYMRAQAKMWDKRRKLLESDGFTGQDLKDAL